MINRVREVTTWERYDVWEGVCSQPQLGQRGPPGSGADHFRPFRHFPTKISDHFRPFPTFSDHFRQIRPFPAISDRSESVRICRTRYPVKKILFPFSQKLCPVWKIIIKHISITSLQSRIWTTWYINSGFLLHVPLTPF